MVRETELRINPSDELVVYQLKRGNINQCNIIDSSLAGNTLAEPQNFILRPSVKLL